MLHLRSFFLLCLKLAITAMAFALAVAVANAQVNRPVLEKFLPKVEASLFVPDATGYGEIRNDTPVAPILKQDTLLGYAFITSDFVSTTGYSGKPIHVMVAIDLEGRLLGAELVEHAEPIVLIGIPDSKIKKLTAGYKGLDIIEEAAQGGDAHDLEIISGATVTIMIIDDSIVRSAIKVARAMGLGGLSQVRPDQTQKRELSTDDSLLSDWHTMSGDGTVRRLTLDVGQINDAFEDAGDPRAIERPIEKDAETTYIDLHTALVSQPSIGRSLLGHVEYDNLDEWLDEGEHAILLAARGLYSYKGSGYVRGGIFDRIQLIQNDISVRFRDKDQRRIGEIAADGAPSFTEMDLFRIPANAEFDPAKPWRLQLLVHREIGPVEKTFMTFDLGYKLPERYLVPLPKSAPAASAVDSADDQSARAALWKRIWLDKQFEITVLGVMLAVLTATFFFQKQFTRNARFFYWFRMGFLVVTLLFLGWGQNAQLSIVNLMALGATLQNGFSWDAFLLDPLVFILWFSVAAALLFWGRGAFCGWLCPFGALQEISNQIARFFKVPQWELPWGLHERLWPIKYIIFLGLFGVSLVSIPMAEQFAEVEPFKTAIILKFDRAWPFVLFATVLLGIGLFIERFYCRYLCPLGAALAIPGRIRMFDWLNRYKECGNPCQTCANECFVQAIHPNGQINPNECLSCLHCQVLYQDDQKCPVCIKKRKGRERRSASEAATRAAMEKLLNKKSTQGISEKES